MLRNTSEALLISAYALGLNIAALAVALLVFVGRDGFLRHIGIGLFLLALASCAVFGTALFALRRGPIDSTGRGLRVGLAAGFVFYMLILIAFGAIPVLAYLPTGDLRTAAGYFGDVIRIGTTASYGLPLITGAFGGALYGWIRKTRAAP